MLGCAVAQRSVSPYGATSDDLQRQLLAPYPEIPSGFDLEDFRSLQRTAQRISFNACVLDEKCGCRLSLSNDSLSGHFR